MADGRRSYYPHDHAFGQDIKRPGESRTLIVIAITGAMMIVEIVAGIVYGSMALLADGLHMASHAAALGINAFAYVYARRHANDPTFCFGTGKVNTLGGFTGAILLAGFAGLMAYESIVRLVVPVAIRFDQAIWVAVVGLVVNAVSVVILGYRHEHGHHHGHGHDHEHEHEHEHDDEFGEDDPLGGMPGHHHAHGADAHAHHDHNLMSAYLHVLADALTSLLAIVALLSAKYFGWTWFDPLMGIVGAVLVGRWSWGLMLETSRVLLDRSAPADLLADIRSRIAARQGEILDLHVWAVGPGLFAAIVTVAGPADAAPEDYRRCLRDLHALVHVTVEPHRRDG
jgi:cation diffusion facilitator family transporter